MSQSVLDGVDLSNAADIDAILAQLREAKKSLVDADRARFGALCQEVADAIILETEAPSVSEKSGWTGYSRYGIPVTVDGVLYHARVQLTDVAATEAAKTALKAAGKTPVEDDSTEK